MTSRGRIALWIIVAAQLGVLIGFIGVREASLRTGTEVVLQTVPVDPRSLLQGDYAILDYEVASLPDWMRGGEWTVGRTVYVSIRERGDVWTAERYTDRRSDVAGGVFLKGRIDRSGHLDFGIGTYFVPEGTGRIIERAADVRVVVSVDGNGNAVIKDVLVDGAPFDPHRGRSN